VGEELVAVLLSQVGNSGVLGLVQDAQHLVGGGFIKGMVRTYQKGP